MTPAPAAPAAALLAAADYAARRHSRQRRKDRARSPYINHPLAVAAVLAAEAGIDDLETLQAALLHDTIEDSGATPEELAERFGPAVAGLVAELSDDQSLPSRRRKELQVAGAAGLSRRAAEIRLADKIANLRDVARELPRGWTTARARRYFDWAKAVADGIPSPHPGLIALFRATLARRP